MRSKKRLDVKFGRPKCCDLQYSHAADEDCRWAADGGPLCMSATLMQTLCMLELAEIFGFSVFES